MSAWFSILVDTPARLLGKMIGPLVGMTFLVASIAAGMGVGRWVFMRYGKIPGWIVGLIVWVYVAMVLFRTQHWAAFALLQAGDD